MKRLFLIALALLAYPVFFGCTHHHQGKPGVDGTNGVDGADGPSAIDTPNFDFIRNIDESLVTGSFWIGDASLVLPPAILAAAPVDPDREGLILYVGLVRYLLTATKAGEYIVVDRGEGSEELGTVSFAAPGHLAIVELSALDALGLLLELADKDVTVQSSGTTIVDAKRTELRIGTIRIRIGGQ